MEARLQRRVQRYGWDAAAHTYDAVWRENLRPVHDALFELAALQPGERVFEPACGSGFASLRAAELVGPRGQVRATDISARMVELVTAQADERGLRQLTVERADAETPAPTSATFDAALCALGLMYLPEPDDALRAMHQALKPNGRAVAAVWGERRNCAWADLFPITDSLVQSEVCPLFFALGNHGALADSFETAGFTVTETRRIVTNLTFADEAGLLQAMVDGGAVALAAKRFDNAARQRLDQAFMDSVAAHRHGAGFAIPAEFVIVIGQKPERP